MKTFLLLLAFGLGRFACADDGHLLFAIDRPTQDTQEAERTEYWVDREPLPWDPAEGNQLGIDQLIPIGKRHLPPPPKKRRYKPAEFKGVLLYELTSGIWVWKLHFVYRPAPPGPGKLMVKDGAIYEEILLLPKGELIRLVTKIIPAEPGEDPFK